MVHFTYFSYCRTLVRGDQSNMESACNFLLVGKFYMISSRIPKELLCSLGFSIDLYYVKLFIVWKKMNNVLQWSSFL